MSIRFENPPHLEKLPAVPWDIDYRHALDRILCDFEAMVQLLNVSPLHSLLRLGLGISLLSAALLTIATPTRAGDRSGVEPIATPDLMAQTANIPAPSIRTLERDTLRLGSEGEDVREFQAIMALLGYYSGEITGQFDVATAQAAQSFQASAGLAIDAIVGPLTWGRLLPAVLDNTIVEATAMTSANANTANSSTVPAPDRVRASNRNETSLPTVQLGSNGSLVSYLQQRLTALGYYSGAIDGSFGPVTQAAVIEAQIDFGLVPDGVVDASVWPYLTN
ncbi:MAG: peptidoglycan-binding protein [Oscillatoriales cyanobacterium]|nr:MAG: peptidoglycan-binding protein [Oscillatoriales cyanobacterium]